MNRVRSATDFVGGHTRSVFVQLRRELDTLLIKPWRQLPRKLPAIDVALVAVTAIVFVGWSQRVFPHITDLLCGERAVLPFPLALARLPGSMVAPAPRLPMWGALAQVLLCFGLAEVHLGRRRTLLVIAFTHSIATLFGRMFIALGPHAPLHLGLPRWNRWERDTGPSAAVVGLGTMLGVLLRLPILTGMLVLSMLIEAAIKPDLADREHLVAIATGGLIALAIQSAPFSRRPSTQAYLAG